MASCAPLHDVDTPRTGHAIADWILVMRKMYWIGTLYRIEISTAIGEDLAIAVPRRRAEAEFATGDDAVKSRCRRQLHTP